MTEDSPLLGQQVLEEEQINTNIGKTYNLPNYNFPIPDPLDDPNSRPTFSGPNREIYNQHYMKISDFNDFPAIPDANNFESYEQYRNELVKWQKSAEQFSANLTLPIPIGHYLPRPTKPDVITQQDREDMNTMRKLKRLFNPETSPASPGNEIEIENIVQNGKSFTNEDYLPYRGLNGESIPIRAHISQENSWATRLIPAKPEPFLYEYFDDYEDALIRWANLVKESDFLPPSPQDVGNMIDLQVDGKLDLEPPCCPNSPITHPKPLTVFESNSKEAYKNVRRLFKTYKKWQTKSTLPSSKPKKVPFKPDTTYTPPHAGSVSATDVCQHYIDFGVPFTPVDQSLVNETKTQIRRHELATLDVGYMAQPDLIAHGQYDIKMDSSKLISLISPTPPSQPDVQQFLVADLPPCAFQQLLYQQSSDANKTVGQLLSEKLEIEELVNISMLSTSLRFLSRCSITAQYFLGLGTMSEQVLELPLPSLERFVELLAFTAPYSFIVPELPEDELAEAIKASPKSDQQIEQLSNDFRQAQLLKCLQMIVFTSPESFFPFFNVIRPLIHKCFTKISDAVMSDVTFPLILEGFMSTNLSVHMFYFRLLRTIVTTNYSRLIRVFAIHKLLRFFVDCVKSTEDVIKKDASSLWQLTMHTDSSLALRIQLLNTKPSVFTKMLNEAPPKMQQNLLGVLLLFRCNEAEFDYRPFPFKLYTEYVMKLCNELGNPFCVRALELLLGLMLDQQLIYCQNKGELKEFANRFMKTQAQNLVSKNLFRCIKIMYKIELLEPSAANNSELWGSIFNSILGKNTETDTRLILWQILRNALLHQRGFMSFILGNQDLTGKFEEAFSSLDENVSNCMILIMPSLVVARRTKVKEFVRNNLDEFFKKLADKDTVRIAGRLLTAYQSHNTDSLMAKVHSSVIAFLKYILEESNKHSKGVNYIALFKQSLDDTLKDVFSEVEKKNIE